jgi:hypothetical protein
MKVNLHEVAVELVVRWELARCGTDRTRDLACLGIIALLSQQAMIMSSLFSIVLLEEVVL